MASLAERVDGFGLTPEDVLARAELASLVRAIVSKLPTQERALIERELLPRPDARADGASIGVSRSGLTACTRGPWRPWSKSSARVTPRVREARDGGRKSRSDSAARRPRVGPRLGARRAEAVRPRACPIQRAPSLAVGALGVAARACRAAGRFRKRATSSGRVPHRRRGTGASKPRAMRRRATRRKTPKTSRASSNT